MRILLLCMALVGYAPTGVAAESPEPDRIERFGFGSRTIMGVGGFLTVDIYPVVLFRDGDALKDVKGLSFPGGLEAHKRAHPGQWTKWRQAGGQWELAGKDGWEALPFKQTYAALPKDFRLDGLFRSVSGAGSVSIGGGQSVTAWSDYRFFPDGRVIRGGGAGSRTEEPVSVTTQNVAPNRRGRYQIDGLKLSIRYDDGSGEERILITNPQDPKSSIWLDGTGYARRPS